MLRQILSNGRKLGQNLEEKIRNFLMAENDQIL